MSTDIYKDDIGVKIVLETDIDISAYTTIEIHYRKPGGDSGTWTATIESGNTSLSYTSVSGDINEAGTWRLQAYVITPTWTQHGEIARMNVLSNL